MSEALPVVYLAHHGETARSILGRHIPESPICRQHGAHRGDSECLGLIKIFA